MTQHISGTTPSDLTVGGIEQNDLFDALSHPYRRFAVQHLSTAETPLAVEELTAAVARWERDQQIADGRGSDEAAVELALVHVHLPKLDEADMVDYDSRRRTVESASRTDEAQSHLHSPGPE